MQRSLRRRRSAGEEPLLNLTPLIDVVFVVLIAFMVMAPLLEREEIALAAAAGLESRPVEKSSSIAIAVAASGQIRLDGHPVELLQLETFLTEARGRDPTAIPQLLQDENAPFGRYQAVKNAVERAGFVQLDLILMPPSPPHG